MSNLGQQPEPPELAAYFPLFNSLRATNPRMPPTITLHVRSETIFNMQSTSSINESISSPSFLGANRSQVGSPVHWIDDRTYAIMLPLSATIEDTQRRVLEVERGLTRSVMDPSTESGHIVRTLGIDLEVAKSEDVRIVWLDPGHSQSFTAGSQLFATKPSPNSFKLLTCPSRPGFSSPKLMPTTTWSELLLHIAVSTLGPASDPTSASDNSFDLEGPTGVEGKNAFDSGPPTRASVGTELDRGSVCPAQRIVVTYARSGLSGRRRKREDEPWEGINGKMSKSTTSPQEGGTAAVSSSYPVPLPSASRTIPARNPSASASFISTSESSSVTRPPPPPPAHRYRLRSRQSEEGSNLTGSSEGCDGVTKGEMGLSQSVAAELHSDVSASGLRLSADPTVSIPEADLTPFSSDLLPESDPPLMPTGSVTASSNPSNGPKAADPVLLMPDGHPIPISVAHAPAGGISSGSTLIAKKAEDEEKRNGNGHAGSDDGPSLGPLPAAASGSESTPTPTTTTTTTTNHSVRQASTSAPDAIPLSPTFTDFPSSGSAQLPTLPQATQTTQNMMINPAHTTLIQLVRYHEFLLGMCLIPLFPEMMLEDNLVESDGFGSAIEDEWRHTGATIAWTEATRLVQDELAQLGITPEVVLASLGSDDEPTRLSAGMTSDGRKKGKGKSGSGDEFVAVVQVGDQLQQLVIPDISLLTSAQTESLTMYNDTKQLLDYLQNLLSAVPFQIPYAGPTTPARGPGSAENGELALFGGRFRFRTGNNVNDNDPDANIDIAVLFSPQLITACLASLIKVQFTLYMTSHGLFTYSIKDKVFWVMMVVSFGWWIWDCYKLWMAEVGRRRRETQVRAALRFVREERERREAGGVGRDIGAVGANANAPTPPIGTQTGATPAAGPNNARAPDDARPAVPTPPPRPLITEASDGLLRIADIGIGHDRRSLRLFQYPDSARPQPQPGVPPDLTVPDRLVPGTQADLPVAPGQPGLWWTMIILPVYLLFTSLVPVWDLRRRGLIRERERHMRTLVEKLTAGRRAERAKELLERAQAGTDAPAQVELSVDIAPRALVDGMEPEHVLPAGLSPLALAYYQRVLARGEQIDWEEEREAQAALMGNAGQGEAGERLDMF